jgi:hypothetical protein
MTALAFPDYRNAVRALSTSKSGPAIAMQGAKFIDSCSFKFTASNATVF